MPNNEWVKGRSYTDLVRNVKKRYTELHIEIPLNLLDLIDEQLCILNSGTDYCVDDPVPGRPRKMPIRATCQELTWKQVKQFSRTMLQWHKDGKEMVSQDEANRRAAICYACVQNRTPKKACTLCTKWIREAVVRYVRDKRSTEFDDELYACGVCCCELKALIWIPKPVLDQTYAVPARNFPANCWRIQP